MKKLTLIFFSLSLSFWAFGQININELERIDGRWTMKGLKSPYSGNFVEYHTNGNLKGTGTLLDGLLTGERITFYENKDTLFVRYYEAGDANGYTRSYYPNKTKKEEGFFSHGKENGKWIFYYETGQQKAIVNFKEKVMDGDFYEFDENGKLLRKLVYENGEAGYGKLVSELVQKALSFDRNFESEKAIPFYNQAIAENPTIPQIYFNRGASKQNNLDFDGAILDYDKAIELDPNYMEAYSNRGNAKINQFTTKGNLNPTPEQTKSACEDFHKAVSLGDKTIGTADMIYTHCKKDKKE